jgi:hypothetical protein
MVNALEALFPGLVGSGYRVTSPPDEEYNCVAWAAGATDGWWWPDLAGVGYWPAGLTRQETLAAVQEAFASLGYAPCADAGLEAGFGKVALFADAQGLPLHVARQLLDGRWTSKLGGLDDIEHALHDLAGIEYGAVALILRRPVAGAGNGRTGGAAGSSGE